jgi:hypothetical protein
MKKIIAGLTATALAGTLAISAVAPAAAQSVSFSIGQRDRVIDRFCDYNPRNRDCRDYYDGEWDRGDYLSFYRSNRAGLDNVAAGLFGFTFGAIVAGALADRDDRSVVSYDDDWRAHVEACYDEFRSYDARTDTYLGFDGDRHQCRL